MNKQPAEPGASRLAWLDGLRAAAAFMVFVHHASPGTALVGLDAGVLVFFSLSGYLLYRPFLTGSVDLWSYAMRRLFRIFPAYLVASVALGLLYGVPLDPWGVITMSNTPVIVAWTLQIEVVFYAALPVIAWAARGRRVPLWVLAAASLGIGGAVLGLTRTIPGGFAAWTWAFVPGMLVAQLSARRPLPRSGWLPAAGIALITASVVPNLVYPDIPAAVGSALVLAWLLTLPAPRPLAGRGMAAAGAVSYSFYLWHEAIHGFLGPATWITAVQTFVLTTAIAGAVYLAVEYPAIRLGRFLGEAPRLPRRERRPAVTFD